MSTWQPRLALEAELQKTDERLSTTPDAAELLFDRAVMLSELGRNEEAKSAYLELLAQQPDHFGALNNLGALLVAMGFHTAARTAYDEAVKYHPHNPAGHVNLANALARNQETEAAIAQFNIALRLAPDHVEAHQGLSHLLTDIGDEENARIHREKGFKDRPILILPYRGTGRPIPLLVLASAAGGTVPIKHHLDDRIFFTSVLFVDFYDPKLPFPPHQLVFNAIGDADVSTPSLAAAMDILKRTKAPVINPPAAVMATGRAANAERLGHISGVITPKMTLLPREKIMAHGLPYPFLLRSPGFHTGRFFMRIENEKALADALPAMPGKELMAIEYLDAKSSDGKIRKYRVMMIGGKLYPLHAAISHDWKIHYFSAEMADNPENRAEDAAFLEDMPKVLGARAMTALKKIQATLGLGYAGVDFSLSKDGDIILFEANATMVVNPPDADTRWDYRRQAVQRVIDAIRQLLTQPASPLAELLTSGGDARIALGPKGTNKYGCFPTPQPDILSYSSCTASTISQIGFAAAQKLYARLEHTGYAREMERIRGELTALCDLSGSDIIFSASGTDVHHFVAQLLSTQPLLVIMPEAAETGSGVPASLQGDNIEVAAIKSREDNGDLRPADIVDAEAEALAERAAKAGKRVLLILTDISKTGLTIPSPACALRLKQRFAHEVDVLVDACQFRVSNKTLRAYLEKDFMLAMTGSKFVTGPAFSAALLMPPSMAARVTSPDTENLGLLLRWEAALAEMRAFHAHSETAIKNFLENFAAAVQKRLLEDEAFAPLAMRYIDRTPITGESSWDHIPTIFPFRLVHPKSKTLLSKDETSPIYERMKRERCYVGQPVACGALRLCADMRLINDALSGRGGDAVIKDAMRVLDKAAALIKTL